jgi:hypothetical protein
MSFSTKSAAGDLILATRKHLRQEAGIGEALLEVPTLHIPFLTPTWVASIRQYLSNHTLTITFTDVLTLSIHRSGDSFIMVPVHLSRYLAVQQKDINLVGMFLQVTYLSNMVSPDGKTILSHYLQGNRPPLFISSATWPHQEQLTLSQQRLWRKYLASSFLRYSPHLLTRIGPIAQPLSASSDEHFPTSDPVTSYDSLASYILALPRTCRRLLCENEQK